MMIQNIRAGRLRLPRIPHRYRWGSIHCLREHHEGGCRGWSAGQRS